MHPTITPDKTAISEIKELANLTTVFFVFSMFSFCILVMSWLP
jgi:hypothetical protein